MKQFKKKMKRTAVVNQTHLLIQIKRKDKMYLLIMQFLIKHLHLTLNININLQRKEALSLKLKMMTPKRIIASLQVVALWQMPLG